MASRRPPSSAARQRRQPERPGGSLTAADTGGTDALITGNVSAANATAILWNNNNNLRHLRLGWFNNNPGFATDNFGSIGLLPNGVQQMLLRYGGLINMGTFGQNVVMSGGLQVSPSSVTASAFFGDGSHLSNVSAASIPNTIASSQTFTSSRGLSHSERSVGIGTTDPGATLEVDGTVNILPSAGNYLMIKSASAGFPPTFLDFQLDELGVQPYIQERPGPDKVGPRDGLLRDERHHQRRGAGTQVREAPIWKVSPSGPKVVTNGSLGIGTTSPVQALDVTGSMVASGFLTAASSVTASAFFGDGSHLTGVAAHGASSSKDNNWSAPQTFQSSVTLAANNFSVGGSTFVVAAGNVRASAWPTRPPPLQLANGGSPEGGRLAHRGGHQGNGRPDHRQRQRGQRDSDPLEQQQQLKAPAAGAGSTGQSRLQATDNFGSIGLLPNGVQQMLLGTTA